MPNYLLDVQDSNGSVLYISMFIPAKSWIAPVGNAGSWRSLNRGLIKPVSGAMWWEEAKGTATSKHLNLLSSGYWGIKFFEFKDLWGANDSGSGVLVQSWVLQAEPGRLSWTVTG